MLDFIRKMVSEELLRLKEEEFEHIHIPTLRRKFKEEIEGGDITETNCNECISNYLKSLDRAIKASKGALGK